MTINAPPACKDSRKKPLKTSSLVANFDRMLFPDQRIRGDCVQIGKILRSQRPELKEFAAQKGLQIEGHS
jgi:hypothetical protein